MRKSFRYEKAGEHVRLTVWINESNAGTLCVREDERDALLMLARVLEADGAVDLDAVKAG